MLTQFDAIGNVCVCVTRFGRISHVVATAHNIHQQMSKRERIETKLSQKRKRTKKIYQHQRHRILMMATTLLNSIAIKLNDYLFISPYRFASSFFLAMAGSQFSHCRASFCMRHYACSIR